MNFTSFIKSELANKTYDSDCCTLSALSAFSHATISHTYSNGKPGFEILTENRGSAEFCSRNFFRIFGAELRIKEKTDPLLGRVKYIMPYNGKDLKDILSELGLTDGSEFEFGISRYLLENECCAKAYAAGAFLGSGSATVPKGGGATGYHLEFVFSNYKMASDFCSLLAGSDIFLKLIERKGGFVAYIKSGQAISDILAFMNAGKSVLKLNEIMVEKSFSNGINRKVNCEMGNMTKQVNAYVAQKLAIEEIDSVLGLDSLPRELSDICRARLEFPDASLSLLADELGISKSCINHRLRKIMRISEELSQS